MNSSPQQQPQLQPQQQNQPPQEDNNNNNIDDTFIDLSLLDDLNSSIRECLAPLVHTANDCDDETDTTSNNNNNKPNINNNGVSDAIDSNKLIQTHYESDRPKSNVEAHINSFMTTCKELENAFKLINDCCLEDVNIEAMKEIEDLQKAIRFKMVIFDLHKFRLDAWSKDVNRLQNKHHLELS